MATYQGRSVNDNMITGFIKDTEHFDPDNRFMALRDLHTLIIEHKVMEKFPHHEEAMKKCFLKGLDDFNMNVKGQANSCLIAAVTGFSTDGVIDVIRKLVKNMVENQKPDLYAIYQLSIHDCLQAMKTDQIDENNPGVKACTDIVLPGIMDGMGAKVKGDDQAEINRNTLARLRELLNVLQVGLDIYGPWCGAVWSQCFDCLKGLLTHFLPEIREQSRGAFGTLVNCVDDAQFKDIIVFAIDFLQNAKEETSNDAVSLVSTICRFAETKIGDYLKDIVPTILSRCDERTEENADIIDACLQAFGTMFLRCPEKLDDFAADMITKTLELMVWDPNMEEVEEEVNAADDDGGDDDDSWGDDDDWGDDGGDGGDDGEDNTFNDANFVVETGADSGDNSWKVRRAAARCLGKTFETRANERRANFDNYVDVISAQLIKERDPRAKIAIAQSFGALLDTCSQEDVSLGMAQATSDLTAPALRRQRSTTDQLMGHWGEISSSIIKQLNASNDSETTMEIIALCSKLLDVAVSAGLTSDNTLQAGFEANFEDLFNALEKLASVEEVQKEVFAFLMKVVNLHSADLVQEKASMIVNMICSNFGGNVSNMMKTLLLNSMAVVMKSFSKGRASWSNPKEMEGLIGNLLEHLNACLIDLKLSNVTKASAVQTGSIAMSSFGDIFGEELKSFIDAIEKRLTDNIVPKAALKALRKMANSSTSMPWNDFTKLLMPVVTPYIRKADKQVREEACDTLAAMISATGNSMSTDQFFNIILNVSETGLLKPQDPKMCEKLFNLFTRMFSIPNMPDKVSEEMMNLVNGPVAELLKSPILGEGSLSACNAFLAVFAGSQKHKNCEKMRQVFLQVMADAANDAVTVNTAQCIATITCAQGPEEAMKFIKKLLKEIDSAKGDQSMCILGELGSLMSLKDMKGIESRIMKVMKESKSPKVRKIAANALGLVVSGDLSAYIEVLLEEMKKSQDIWRYLLTCSLQRTLQVCSANAAKLNALQPYVETLRPLLVNQANTEDEGERSVIGECLGRLGSLNSPEATELLRKTAQGVTNYDDSEQQRATMAIALKSAIIFTSDDSNLTKAGVVEEIYSGLEKEQSQITRTELMACLNLLLTRKVSLVEGEISHIESLVYPHCKTNTELVKKVQIGSMTHVIDDGLPQRIAVYRIMDTLQKDFMWRLNHTDYFKALSFGFADENEDIQARAFAIVCNLTETRLKSIVNHLSGMKGKMTTGAKALLKRSKMSGAEGERAKDHTKTITSYLWKTRKAIPKTQEATCRDFCRFYIAITKTAQLKAYIDAFESA